MGTVSELREIQVTFDAADPAALSRFWAEVLGYRLDDPPEPYPTWDEALEAFGVPEHLRNSASAVHDPTGAGPRLFFQQVPEGKTAKNRVHLDVRAAPGLRGEERLAALEAKCEVLVALGATRVRRYEPDGMNFGHIVMQDPEGNEFCLD
jgi:catechol 2,3-dioxygenase-like lactoylglutathione lyase family enzyme